MTQRQETIERLNGLELEGGSHEMLSAICKSVLPHSGAWTLRMCCDLRDRLVRLLGGDAMQEGGGRMTDTEKAALERRIYDRCIVRVGQLEAEKATLEERIDELCQENERLRKAKDTMRGDAFEMGAMLVKAGDENAKLRELADGAANEADRLTHDAAALQIENAKLRKLCADMWEAIKMHKRINFAQLLRFGERVRELGIEVPA